MLNVIINYHPIGQHTYFKVNGECLKANNKLAKYNKEPMDRWVGELVPLLIREWNEHVIDIAFFGSPTHYRMLADAVNETGNHYPEIIIKLIHGPFDPMLERRDELANAASAMFHLLQQEEFVREEGIGTELTDILKAVAKSKTPESLLKPWDSGCRQAMAAMDEELEAVIKKRADLLSRHEPPGLTVELKANQADIQEKLERFESIKREWENEQQNLHAKLDCITINANFPAETIQVCMTASFYDLYLDIERFVALDAKPAILLLFEALESFGGERRVGKGGNTQIWINGAFSGNGSAMDMLKGTDGSQWKQDVSSALKHAINSVNIGLRKTEEYIAINEELFQQERVQEQRRKSNEAEQSHAALNLRLERLKARQHALQHAKAIIQTKLEALG
ncbi:hypothetical protein [Paenibacillus agricola]|uniref:Uncharacterized protein n=1 Tax=Paenibacillus agricola TaxID=2716264 RepID=A0ABX0JK46_9BACL|nr:hypothetical protein [Paenibacillus agricola]NHN34361.1 hypothetical protein [Paenibacillus agricola]